MLAHFLLCEKRVFHSRQILPKEEYDQKMPRCMTSKIIGKMEVKKMAEKGGHNGRNKANYMNSQSVFTCSFSLLRVSKEHV